MKETTHTLTSSEIARIYAMYAPCNMAYKGEPNAGVMNYDDILNLAKNPDWQLLLSPLSAITDEDAIEVARIANVLPYGWDQHFTNFKINRLEYPDEGVEVRVNRCAVRVTNGKVIYFYDDRLPNTAMHISNSLQCWQYLIQRGYAVPCFIAPNHPDNGKDAIQLGIALDKTKGGQ